MCPPTLRLEVSQRMLADQLDYVIGVDPHRDSHALAVVRVISGAIVFEATVAANSEGYAHALELVDQHAAGRRAFAVEGTGSFGAGLTRFFTSSPQPDPTVDAIQNSAEACSRCARSPDASCS